jgi:hypothetical protein
MRFGFTAAAKGRYELLPGVAADSVVPVGTECSIMTT